MLFPVYISIFNIYIPPLPGCDVAAKSGFLETGSAQKLSGLPVISCSRSDDNHRVLLIYNTKNISIYTTARRKLREWNPEFCTKPHAAYM